MVALMLLLMMRTLQSSLQLQVKVHLNVPKWMKWQIFMNVSEKKQ